MRVIEIKAYTFEELSKAAQRKALNQFSDYNTEENWWNWTYEDAKEIGIQINGFDLNSYRSIEFTSTRHNSWVDVARLIVNNWPDVQENILVDAAKKLLEWNTVELVKCALLEDPTEGYHESDDTEETGDFQTAIQKYFFERLTAEFEYLSSDEAIQEIIESNGYEFDEQGNKLDYEISESITA